MEDEFTSQSLAEAFAEHGARLLSLVEQGAALKHSELKFAILSDNAGPLDAVARSAARSALAARKGKGQAARGPAPDRQRRKTNNEEKRKAKETT